MGRMKISMVEDSALLMNKFVKESDLWILGCERGGALASSDCEVSKYMQCQS